MKGLPLQKQYTYGKANGNLIAVQPEEADIITHSHLVYFWCNVSQTRTKEQKNKVLNWPLRAPTSPAALTAVTRVLKTGQSATASTMLPLGGIITAFSSCSTPLEAILSTLGTLTGAHWAVIWHNQIPALFQQIWILPSTVLIPCRSSEPWCEGETSTQSRSTSSPVCVCVWLCACVVCCHRILVCVSLCVYIDDCINFCHTYTQSLYLLVGPPPTSRPLWFPPPTHPPHILQGGLWPKKGTFHFQSLSVSLSLSQYQPIYYKY